MNTFYPAVNSGQVSGVKCYTLAQVKAENPAAYAIVKVDGGWMVFDNADDYNTWRKQK
jgi:hypothetical protein